MQTEDSYFVPFCFTQPYLINTIWRKFSYPVNIWAGDVGQERGDTNLATPYKMSKGEGGK